MAIYLYVKTHNTTGLKYLGFTRRDPIKYKGSGTRWRAHIKKYGYDVSTNILLQSDSTEDIKNTGLFFSKLWNIVESQEWANLKPEDANAVEYTVTFKKRLPHSEETKRKISLSKQGNKNGMFGRKNTKSPETVRKLKNSLATSANIKKRNSSVEWRSNISIAQSIPVYLVSSKTGEIISSYRNAQHAAEILGCTRGNINSAIRNNREIGKKIPSITERCYVTRQPAPETSQSVAPLER